MLRSLLRILVPSYQEILDSGLVFATRQGNLKEVEYLLENGANIKATDARGDTLLYIAVCKNFLQVAQCLISRGANVNSINGELGNTPLHAAASYGGVEMVQLLVANHADSCQSNNEGYTPVHYAAYGGAADVLQLLAAPNNINLQANDGVTPLFLSVDQARPEHVKVLADVDTIDWNLPDKFGKSPLMVALDQLQTLHSEGDSQKFEAYLPIVTLLLERSDIQALPESYKSSPQGESGYLISTEEPEIKKGEMKKMIEITQLISKRDYNKSSDEIMSITRWRGAEDKYVTDGNALPVASEVSGETSLQHNYVEVIMGGLHVTSPF